MKSVLKNQYFFGFQYLFHNVLFTVTVVALKSKEFLGVPLISPQRCLASFFFWRCNHVCNAAEARELNRIGMWKQKDEMQCNAPLGPAKYTLATHI